MTLIPNETKNNVPTFWGARFSNDGVLGMGGVYTNEPTRILIDGYNEDGELVHPDFVLRSWLGWSENHDEIISEILSTAIEYTKDEFIARTKDVNSIWYVEYEE